MNTRVKIIARVVLTFALPLFLIWAFFATLVCEIGRAFRYAWLEVRITVEQFWQEMRRHGLTDDDIDRFCTGASAHA